MAPGTILRGLSPLCWHAAIMWLRLIVFRIFRESNGYAFVRVGEPVANGRRHCILSRLRRVVIDKGYPLPVLVLRQTNLMEAIELGKYLLELLLRNILRYVANVEGKHLLGSFRSDCT